MNEQTLMLLARLLAGGAALVTIAGLVGILLLRRRMKRDEQAAAQKARQAAFPEEKKPVAPASATGSSLPDIARREALRGFHGCVAGLDSNLQPIVSRFEAGAALEQTDWSAAFAYHCVRLAGYPVKARQSEELCTARAWEAYARAEGKYLSREDAELELLPGDLVLYAEPEGHVGVVLETDVENNRFTAAEGCVGGVSAVVTRPLDGRVLGRIRLD